MNRTGVGIGVVIPNLVIARNFGGSGSLEIVIYVMVSQKTERRKQYQQDCDPQRPEKEKVLPFEKFAHGNRFLFHNSQKQDKADFDKVF